MSPSTILSGGSLRGRALGALGLALLAAIGAPTATFPHGGEIEVGAGGARGPVQLSAAQASAIGLETTAAGPHPLASILTPVSYTHLTLPTNREV